MEPSMQTWLWVILYVLELSEDDALNIIGGNIFHSPWLFSPFDFVLNNAPNVP